MDEDVDYRELTVSEKSLLLELDINYYNNIELL